MRTFFSAWLVAFLLAPQVPEQGQVHSKHFLFGMPAGAPAENDLIVRDIYVLSNNASTKFADWLAYRLDKATVDGDAKTNRNLKADPWLDDHETLEPPDYKDANKELGTDRGHQAPLASFRGSTTWVETNYLSNITPQKAPLNQGPWKKLEDAVRELVRTGTVVWVLTGPVYERDWATLPGADEPHTIPSSYWKIVATADPSKPGSIRATAFLFDQDTPRHADYQQHIVRIDTIEDRTGLNFFTASPDHIESQVEHMKNVWPPGGEQ